MFSETCRRRSAGPPMPAPNRQKVAGGTLLSRRRYLVLSVQAALVAATVMAAGPLPQGRPSFVDETLNQVLAINLREELSPEAQAFAVRELKLSFSELARIKTFLIPEELMQGLLSNEENARNKFAYFYLYREQLEELKDQLLSRINSASREQRKQRLSYGDLEYFFASLQTRIYGTNQSKKQYAILILPRNNEEIMVRDSRLLHELKHYTQNLPVYFSAENNPEFEADAYAFGMHYLAERGLRWPEILETFVDVSGLTAKEVRVKRKEFEQRKPTLLKIWEEKVQPKFNGSEKL